MDEATETLWKAIEDLRDGQTRFMTGIFDQVNDLKSKCYTLEAEVVRLQMQIDTLVRWKGTGP